MLDSFTTEAFTELSVGVLVVVLRTYARWRQVGIRQFMLDDYLMLLAVVVYALETAAAYSVGARYHGLANNSMTDEERRTLSPDSEEYHLRVGGSKLQLIGWSLYTLLLWLLKLCINVFYTRLTTGLHHMQLRIYVGYFLIGSTYVMVVAAILGGCGIPFRKNWQIYPNPGNHCQPAISKYDLFFTVVLNVVTDMYLISIPLQVFWKAQIPLKKKAWLVVMFSGGIFVMAAAILRCVLILTAGLNGAQQAGSWAVRETFVAVVIGNIPMIYPLFASLVRQISQSLSSHRSTGPSDGTPVKDFIRSIRKKPKSANPLSISSSAERIIEDRYRKYANTSDRQVVEEERSGDSSGSGGIHVANQMTVDYELAEVPTRGDGLKGQSYCHISTAGG